KKVLPYKMRNAAMALAATVAGMTTTSCEKEDDILPEQPKIQKHNEYLNLYLLENNPGSVEYPNDIQKIRDKEYIANLLKRDDVDTVFFRARGEDWYTQGAITVVMFSNGLQRFSEQDPSRIRGTGNMNFKLGEASKVPTDSAWLANFGFSINKNVSKGR
ncbi:MAG: hypothetical protein MJ187_02945, partial [Alphaproteobacteria bacterium]|nr:hypothetical protein [Alphaproteobacteria bacterium]